LKTILTLEVEYDPSMTDPEGLATAMDRLLETACSTPRILDEYGNPTLGEFLVAVSDPCGPATVVLNVSGGVVQDAFCSPASMRVVLVDWDTEGQDATNQGVYQVETQSGRSYYAFVTQLPAAPLDQVAGRDIDRALLAAGIDVEAGPAAPGDSDFIAMCRRVSETAENWADCSDMKEALTVFRELGRDCRAILERGPASPESRRYILYDLDADELGSTTIYDDYREAVDDADQVNDVIVLPISLTPRDRYKENSQ